MENAYILAKIFHHVPYGERIPLETVSTFWSDTMNRCWRSLTTLDVANDLYGPDQYPTKLEQRDEDEICAVIRRCGPYLTQLRLCPVNTRKPFFRNVHRFTARYELTESVLSAVCKHCIKLKMIDLSYHIFPTWSTFQCLERLPVSVEVLLMEICRLDECPSMEGGMKDVMDKCFGRLQSLKVYSLWGSCYGYWTVSHVHFEHVPNTITYLDLSQGFTVKIGDLQSWIPGMTNLGQLHLERTSINDQDLKILVTTCRSTMRGLTLAYAKSIIDFSPISSFDRLQYLRLDGNRDYLNDHALIAICQSCTDLRLLSLENCSSLTSASLAVISELRSLRHLSLSSITSLDDGCLEKICFNCAHLRSIHLKYCRKLTGFGLKKLINLHKLRHLGVSGLPAFNQLIAECIRMKCTKLTVIEAFNCENYR